FNDVISLQASFRTDMSYFDEAINDRTGIKPNITSWNIYHITSGITIDHKNSSLSLGLLFSTGSNNKYEQSGTIDPNEDNLLQGVRSITSAKYQSLGLLVGYTFYIRKF